MEPSPQTAETLSPIEGLLRFVAAHREMALTEPQTCVLPIISKWQQSMQAARQQRTKEFLKLLDAMDTYLTEEVAPRYESESDTRASLDAYWHNRSEMYDPGIHMFPTTKNGLSVARSYLDMVLDHLQIGKDTEAFKAVEEASNAFHVHIYSRDKTGRQVG